MHYFCTMCWIVFFPLGFIFSIKTVFVHGFIILDYVRVNFCMIFGIWMQWLKKNAINPQINLLIRPRYVVNASFAISLTNKPWRRISILRISTGRVRIQDILFPVIEIVRRWYVTADDRKSIFFDPWSRANFTLLKWGEPRIILKLRWLQKTNFHLASRIFMPNFHPKELLYGLFH